jgi:hypothetical protein
MAGASGLLALGQALDDYLVGEYSPPPGTQAALGFLPGIGVDPASFQNAGVVNPALVNEFLRTAVDHVGPVTDGRFVGGMLSAEQLFAALLLGTPLAPGTKAGDAYGRVKGIAGSAFGSPTAHHDVVATPANWYDAANGDGWSRFSTATSRSNETGHGSSTGETPPVVDPTRPFERMWQWRTLDPTVERRVLATAPRMALADLVEARPLLASRERPVMKAQAIARLIDHQAPVLMREIEQDGETVSTQSVESDELTLSLEYCFVEISRSAWWNDLLVKMPGWYVPGLQAGELVPGAALADQQVGVPVAMVLTRNVQVTGRWTEADRNAAASHSSLGPWHIGETDLSAAQSDETATLAITGMQLIAAVCRLLPKLPPANDPDLK